MTDATSFTIHIDGNWSLEDLYLFPHTFEQMYFFVRSLDTNLNEVEIERIDFAYNSMPWQGGYSAVGFYNQLKTSTPAQRRPKLKSFQYASPGVIDLALIVAYGLSVGKLVKIFCSSVESINATLSVIYRDLQKRKLLRIEVEERRLQLSRSELDFSEECAETIASIFGWDVKYLTAKTGNPYKTLKILLSIARRLRILAEYQLKGKAIIPTEDEPIAPTPPKRATRTAKTRKGNEARRLRNLLFSPFRTTLALTSTIPDEILSITEVFSCDITHPSSTPR